MSLKSFLTTQTNICKIFPLMFFFMELASQITYYNYPHCTNCCFKENIPAKNYQLIIYTGVVY